MAMGLWSRVSRRWPRNVTACQVWRAGQLIEMPQREFDVLRVLMEHAGRAVSRR